MRQLKAIALVGVLIAAGSLSVRADVWDPRDNTSTTTINGLIHGSEQVHDVAAQGGVADNDWFSMANTPYSSYQLLVDGLTMNLNNFNVSRRDDADPTTVLQTSAAVGGGNALGMTWENATNTFDHQFVLINAIGASVCNTTCTANDQYRIRLLDTTYLVPRFNNANSQVTVLLAQNSLSSPAAYTAHYFSTSGTLLVAVPGEIPAFGSSVTNLSTIPALQNQTGTIIFTHNAGYGGLAVKSVALEPATGFSFDTPGTYRHR